MHNGTTLSSRPFEHLIAEVADLRNTPGAGGSPDVDPPTFVGKLQLVTSVIPTAGPTETEQTETSADPVPSPTDENTTSTEPGEFAYLARIRLATSVLPTTSPTETSDSPEPSPTEVTTGQSPSDGFDELVAAAEASVRASENRAQAVDVGTVSGLSLGGTARQVTAAAMANGGWLDASLARSVGRVSVFRRRLARAGAVAGNVFDGDRLTVVGQN